MTKPDYIEKGASSRAEMVQEVERKKALIDGKLLSGDSTHIAEQMDASKAKVWALRDNLIKKGINPEGFLYWHILVGSTPREEDVESASLDTNDGAIEKLIDKLASQ